MQLLLQLIWNGFSLGSLYSLFALSFYIIFAVTRIFHFAHGGVYLLGAYLIYVLYVVLHLPIILAVFIAVAFAAVVGPLIDIFMYKPLREMGADLLTILISSMGLFIILQNIMPMIFGPDTLRLPSILDSMDFRIGTVSVSCFDVIIIGLNIVVIILLEILLKYSSIGNCIRAVKDNADLASIIGINVSWIYAIAFAIGSVIIVLAAAIHSMDIGLNSSMGFTALLMGAIAVIVGGMGSLGGSVLAAYMISLAQTVGVWKVSSSWQNTIAFGLLFVFLVLRPKGFFGEKMQASEI